MSPGTEFARDFCTGIGPLQLGVVLVFFIFHLCPDQCVVVGVLEPLGLVLLALKVLPQYTPVLGSQVMATCVTFTVFGLTNKVIKDPRSQQSVKNCLFGACFCMIGKSIKLS